MNKITKRSDLHREWARVLDMCEGTNIKPFECVKLYGLMTCHNPPRFTGDIESYQFALAIVENKPVFVGDFLYSKHYNKRGVIYKSEYNGCMCIKFHTNVYCRSVEINSSDLSWIPPKPNPLCIIEGKDVFAGDELYSRINGNKYTINSILIEKDGIMAFDKKLGCIYIEHLSWHKNKPKAFNLNGVELPYMTSLNVNIGAINTAKNRTCAFITWDNLSSDKIELLKNTFSNL